MSKKMTIEDLAIMLQGEFKAIQEQFKEVFRRLDAIEQRLDRIEFNQASQERRISTLEDRVRIIGTKLGLDLRKA